MLITNIKVSSVERNAMPTRLVTVSVPFSERLVGSPGRLLVQDAQGNVLPSAIQVTQRWPDGSIRWAVIEFASDIAEQNEEWQLHLADVEPTELAPDQNETLAVAQEPQRVVVTSPFGQSTLALDTLAFTPCVALGLAFQPELLAQQQAFTLNTEAVTIETLADQRKAIVIAPAKLQRGKDVLALTFRLTFRAFHPVVELEVCLHNPTAAQHPGGLWDLGDPGSVLFQQFDLRASRETQAACLRLEQDTHSIEQSLRIVQHGSGGDNWQSSNHILSTGEQPIAHPGYVMELDGDPSDGRRCQPELLLSTPERRVAVQIDQFWQNFPSGLALGSSDVVLGLFPNVGYDHELQGGEQKTQTIRFHIGHDMPMRMPTPLRATLNPEYVASTNAFFLLDEYGLEQDETSGLIAAGLSSSNNFFAKREVIDEFGWRHFGDIFADHETIGENGRNVTISHYNNQYDPIYGFLRQYLLTGEQSWFELADDLARHVIDIDLYKTADDRDEYNYGMFWHTDHYLDAKTCSHRTFSRHHESVYDGYTAGGGPGGQHCYSLGLMYHHILTGNVASKQAVVRLAQWMEYVYDGSDTLLAKLFAIKKSQVTGLKNHITGQYPLDRGTGNLVNAQLDAFGLTENKAYLQRAAAIIQNTIHPLDDIAARNFDNIEETWFYTVFLQAVVRFLLEKEQGDTLDASYQYAKDALLHYARWMVANERPYLQQAEKLEFPNTTWAAQDIRKGYILIAAAYFSPEQANAFRTSADVYYRYVGETLSACEHSDSTRILAILMQNTGAKQFFANKTPAKHSSLAKYQQRTHKNKTMAIAGLLLKQLTRLSVRNELKWLSFRSNKVAKLLGNSTHETN